MKKRGVPLLLCLLMLLGLFSIPQTQAEEVTTQCTYDIPDKGNSDYLTDDKILSRVSVKSGKTLAVNLPALSTPVLYAVWFELPGTCILIEKDAAGTEITRRTLEPVQYYESYALSPGCVRAELKAGKDGMVLSTLLVFEDSVPREYPCYVEGADPTCDLLFVAGEPHGLLEHFGALLPYYFNGLGLSTGVAIAHIGTRKELHEVTVALWSLGFTNAPLLGNFEDNNVEDYNNVSKKWTERNTKKIFTECLRKTKARVVVTEDTSSSEPRAKFTAEMLVESWNLSGQDNQFQESVEVFGTHTPEKLYTLTHGSTTVDASEVYFADGNSLSNLLTEAYRLVASRQMFHIVPPLAVQLTLQQSTVGKDNAGKDLLENLSTDSLRRYQPNFGAKETPTPEPTEAPTPEPTQEPTLKPTNSSASLPIEESSSTPAPVDTFAGSTNTGLYILLGVVLAAILGALLYFIRQRNQNFPVFALWILPLLIGLLVAGLCIYDTMTQAAQAQAEAERLVSALTDTPVPTTPTPEPTPELTPEPTEAPTYEPTQEPASEPTADSLTDFDRHFLNDGRVEVVEKDDDENGEWIYRSDILAVEIQRHESVRNDEPVVYLVAHIYMRNFDSFQPTFPSAKKTGMETGTAQSMAKRYRSVLWITGDNIIHAEKEKKGVLIRNGRIYSANRASDVLVLHSDTLSLEVLPKSAYTAQQILESGVENTYSFFIGPNLVKDGQIHKDTTTRTAKNPRCGIGQIAPGHFVAILADGRQDNYSNGLTLTQFAELFIEEGCTMAYNLDGGVSTCMLFMGKMINKVANNNKTGSEASWLRLMPDGLSFGYTNLPGHFTD